MRHLSLRCTCALATLFLALGACSETPEPQAQSDESADESDNASQVSRFGEYDGYSEERFSEWVRQSQYIESHDGTRIAIDIVRPAVDGVPTDEPLPVVWTHTRYQRNPTGGVRTRIEMMKAQAEAGEDLGGREIPEMPAEAISNVDGSEVLQRLVKHGYVVASVAVRGSGASFGRYEGVFSPEETQDAYEIIDWLSQQSWSSGKIGTYGLSYLAGTQYMAISTGHPALQASIPNAAPMTLYGTFYWGGIYQSDFMDRWGEGVHMLDTMIRPSTVDEDPEGVMLDQAIAEHATNWRAWKEWRDAPYRDHKSDTWEWYGNGSTSVLDKWMNSDVAVYHMNGWYDLFVNDTPRLFVNYQGPDKMSLGHWPHTGYTASVGAERRRIESAEHHRWFDYWLKGIDNGVMDEAAINFAIADIPGVTWEWREATEWPMAQIRNETLYFAEGLSGSVESVNDGLLLAASPVAGSDEYEVDLTTTTYGDSLWVNSNGGQMFYPDMTENDRKSLTYTTPALEEDLVFVGSPVVTVYVSTTGTDLDVHALIEEVDENGFSHYVTEGKLRASHRAINDAPWDNVGLPWHRSHESDVQLLEVGEVAEMAIVTMGASHRFNAGNRLRVTVMGADADNTEPPVDPDATISVRLGGKQASSVSLPVFTDE